MEREVVEWYDARRVPAVLLGPLNLQHVVGELEKRQRKVTKVTKSREHHEKAAHKKVKELYLRAEGQAGGIRERRGRHRGVDLELGV